MTNYPTAFESIKNAYDLDTLREIVEHGCASGVATDHVYYRQTSDFFDFYQQEVCDYLIDNFGSEFLVELFSQNEAHLTGYKNDVVWVFIETVAQQLVDEFETTMIEYEQEIGDTYAKELAFS